MSTLQELLTDELRDLLDAEKQLTKALPRMARAASSPELKQAFLDHTEMTKNQVARLEQVFEFLGEKAKSKPCKAMKGLVEEASEHIGEHERGKQLDAVLVASAQRVEHYEIAGYGTARSYAKSLGAKDAMNLLNETLKEEEMTDKLLSKIGLQVQKECLQEEGESAAAAEEQMGRYAAEAGRARSGTGRGGARGSNGAGVKKK
jgi:ferritin-like metal-binding protein YciE